MAEKKYLELEGLQELVNYINLSIKTCKDAFETAIQAGVIKPGTGLVLKNDGTLSIADDYTNSILARTSDAAGRASQSAVLAGNYAAQAIQAQRSIENKIWYGTIEEYNALETVSDSTIYIILHE